VFAEEANARSIVGEDSRMKFFPAVRYFFRGESSGWKSRGLDVQRIPYPVPRIMMARFVGGAVARAFSSSTSANRAMMTVTAQKIKGAPAVKLSRPLLIEP
jgi:hypothetical protein